MRNIVLASLLGASASAFVLPSVGAGPVHFRVTQPHSVTALGTANNGWATTTLPTTALDFVVTDITFGASYTATGIPIELKANGTTIFVGRTGGYAYGGAPSIHLNTGVLIPAGATLTATTYSNSQQPLIEGGITLSGYIQ